MDEHRTALKEFGREGLKRLPSAVQDVLGLNGFQGEIAFDLSGLVWIGSDKTFRCSQGKAAGFPFRVSSYPAL